MPRLYVSLEFRISERTIQKEYEGHPYPNADGTIDYYREHMGEFTGAEASRFDTYEEADNYFRGKFPSLFGEEEVRFIVREVPCEKCKRKGWELSFRKGYGEICNDCNTALDLEKGATEEEWKENCLTILDAKGYIPTDWILHYNGDIEHKDGDNYQESVIPRFGC